VKAISGQPVLTSADHLTIRADLLSLAGWLGYGMAGVCGPAHWASLTPIAGNWFHAAAVAQDEEACYTVAADATKEQVASFAWFVLNCIRHRKGQPIFLPGKDDLLGKGRNRGVLGELYETQGAAAAASIILLIDNHIDEILKSLSWMSGGPPGFDVGLFRHTSVLSAAQKLTPADDDATVNLENYL
jgi:hypothetical protein